MEIRFHVTPTFNNKMTRKIIVCGTLALIAALLPSLAALEKKEAGMKTLQIVFAPLVFKKKSAGFIKQRR